MALRQRARVELHKLRADSGDDDESAVARGAGGDARPVKVRPGPGTAPAQAGAKQRAAGWSTLRPLIAERRGAVVVLAITSLLSGVTESAILAILAETAAALVNRTSHVHASLGPLRLDASIGSLIMLALALAVVRLILQVIAAVVPARMAAGLLTQLRSKAFAAFTSASWGMQSRDREGYLQEIMTNQSMQFLTGVMQAIQLGIALLTFLVLVASALLFNVLAALLVLVMAAALFAGLRPLSSLGSRRAQATSRASIDYASGVNATVRLAEETHVFGVAMAQRRRIGELIAAVRAPYFDVQLLSRLVPGIYQSSIYLLLVAALGGLYATGAGHVASLGAVLLLLVRAGAYGQQAQSAYQSVREALPYLDRVQQAQERYEASSADRVTLHHVRIPLNSVNTLAFEKVCFAYEQARPVLSDVDFEVAAGETIGVVGPSGAGKSTLVQILLGLRVPDSGHYLVNGVSADHFDREDWHKRVSYVSQEPRLLHATVADNIRFLRDNIGDDEVERAARLAGIHDDIMKWSNGYDTIVGPRADAVSGGQQQRICLARALADQPEVLVLDEPTSALDPHSEMLIQESLAGLRRELTLFIAAHRMSTLDICERVMVIVDGRLQAFDTADALLRSNGYYRSASKLGVGAPSMPS
jgi:ATP-binding cassette subfamily B protein